MSKWKQPHIELPKTTQVVEVKYSDRDAIKYTELRAYVSNGNVTWENIETYEDFEHTVTGWRSK